MKIKTKLYTTAFASILISFIYIILVSFFNTKSSELQEREFLANDFNKITYEIIIRSGEYLADKSQNNVEALNRALQETSKMIDSAKGQIDLEIIIGAYVSLSETIQAMINLQSDFMQVENNEEERLRYDFLQEAYEARIRAECYNIRDVAENISLENHNARKNLARIADITSLSFLIVLIIVVVGSTLYHAQSISAYLKRIIESARRIGDGDLNTGVPHEGNNEFGKLSHSLDLMRINLKSMKDEEEKINERLQQAQKMESIGTLAGGIAHDFNNILAGIFGLIELSKGAVDNREELQEYLNLLDQGANRAKDLVQKILTFSRKQESKTQSVIISEVLEEALGLLRSSIPTSIKIESKIENPGPILANPIEIHQIIMNLATNAAHAMEDSGGILQFHLSGRSIVSGQSVPQVDLPTGEYALLIVSDTGKGISPEIKKRIFDPYFTTKKQGKGTGLGLSVVHGIIQKNKGQIHVYSEENKGTAFHIYLPINLNKGTQNNIKQKTVISQGNQERILLIDDEKSIIETLPNLLNKYNYQVEAMSDPMKAWEQFKSQPDAYDLVITDLTMPDISGLDLARLMKKMNPKLPIILMTGNCSGIDFVDALHADHCFIKPVQMSELIIKIQELTASLNMK